MSGEEARARILDAAGEQLRISGPSGLRLDPIAEELGVSRQALLHHFGTRDGLIAAVVSGPSTPSRASSPRRSRT